MKQEEGPNGLPLSDPSNKLPEYHRYIFRKRDLGVDVTKLLFVSFMLLHK
jgi:hypothetical protein